MDRGSKSQGLPAAWQCRAGMILVRVVAPVIAAGLFLGGYPPASAETLSDIAARDLRELAAQLPGVYSNAERVYFDGLTEDLPSKSKAQPLSLTITPVGAGDPLAFTLRWEGAGMPDDPFTYAVISEVGNTGRLQMRFQRAQSKNSEREGSEPALPGPSGEGDGCISALRVAAGGMALGGECGFASISKTALGLASDGGRDHLLMKARPFSCWLSVPKAQGDGYTWHPGLEVHDQGGMVWVDDAEAKTPRVGLRLRRVDWPFGRNRNSLVLYVHTSDADSADSYVWTGYDGDRLAINLRWMQASCTLAQTSRRLPPPVTDQQDTEAE